MLYIHTCVLFNDLVTEMSAYKLKLACFIEIKGIRNKVACITRRMHLKAHIKI